MRALDRKLLRDLLSMKGQMIAITAILAVGVMGFVTMLLGYRGLRETRDAYYRRYRMPDLFAPVKRAPRSVVRDLEQVPGVRRVRGRIVFDVTLELRERRRPVSGRVLSLPDRDENPISGVHLSSGAWFDGDGDRQVIVADRFARTHGLEVGDSLPVLMNNRKEALRIVGTALSPEFVYMIRGFADLIPDPENFTVGWLSRSFAEAVFDFEDSCNDFVATLERDANVEEVIEAFDRRLDRYGALGAYGVDDHLPNRYLKEEIRGLKGTATYVPAVFLLTAAFVLNMVMGRLVRTQRMQIAVFRAFGYRRRDLVLHYLGMVGLVGVLGAAAGCGLGIWRARSIAVLYQEFYDFPILRFDADPTVMAGGVLVCVGAAALGAWTAVVRVLRLEPAESMRPEAPPVYRRTLLERIGPLWRSLGFVPRMIVRDVVRTRFRTTVTVLGVALSAAILLLAFFAQDSVRMLVRNQYRDTERQDLRLAFHDERGRAALYELRRLPGVRMVEPELTVPVRLVNGRRTRRTGITGLARGQTLRGLHDRAGRPVPLPGEGLLLSRKLADLLDVRAGDPLRVEVLIGEKPALEILVENVVEESMGAFAYANLPALSRWVGESHAMTGALVLTDPARTDALETELSELPAVSAVVFKEDSIENFEETLQESQAIMIGVLIVIAGVIAFGVIYNAARISLSERQRDLGSMRVLGFTRRETSAVLVGENLLLVALAIPVGIAIGAALCKLLTVVYDTDLYRFPFVLLPETLAKTAGIVVGFAIVSNLAVRRRLDKLDMVEVLKARE